MNIDLIVQVISIFGGAAAIWKIATEFPRGKGRNLRDEYRFAREFFEELEQKPLMHNFLKQKGYQAIAGGASLSAEEIEYLLTLNDSVKSIRDYVFGRPYVEYLRTSIGTKIVYKNKYRSRQSRLLRKFWFFALYLLCYFLWTAPVFLFISNRMAVAQAFTLFIYTTIIFLPMAYFSLRSGLRVGRAEMLINSQL